MDSEQYSDICKGNRLGGHITVIRLKISGQYNISHGLTISTQRCQRTYTYIHNWPLQPFSQDYGLASHTTYVVCVNFIREWRDLQSNFDSEL